MKLTTYIQDEHSFVLLGGILFFVLLIWWVRSGEIKELRKLEEEYEEMDSVTKMYKWRVYIFAVVVILIFFNEIVDRLIRWIYL